jgi:hypothetical protein
MKMTDDALGREALLNAKAGASIPSTSRMAGNRFYRSSGDCSPFKTNAVRIFHLFRRLQFWHKSTVLGRF